MVTPRACAKVNKFRRLANIHYACSCLALRPIRGGKLPYYSLKFSISHFAKFCSKTNFCGWVLHQPCPVMHVTSWYIYTMHAMELKHIYMVRANVSRLPRQQDSWDIVIEETLPCEIERSLCFPGLNCLQTISESMLIALLWISGPAGHEVALLEVLQKTHTWMLWTMLKHY